MKKNLSILAALVALFVAVGCAPEAMKNELRAPAYPLITIDPYTSAWSTVNNLYDDKVRHWTGADFPLVGALRVDDTIYRFMGSEVVPMYPLAPMSYEEDWSGRYTFDEPAKGWQKSDFDDSKWKMGEASFGTDGQPHLRTKWQTEHIWVRREIEIDPAELKDGSLFIKYSHDDTFQLYFNGRLIISTPMEWKADMWAEVPAEVAATAAKDGKIVLAAHCHNPQGGALLDMGVYKRKEGDNVLSKAARQTSVDVQATRTIYDFKCGGVDLRLTFMAPLLMDDLELISRPVNYISYEVVSNDEAEHDVDIYFEAAQDWARNSWDQPCVSTVAADDRFNYVQCGTESQNVLGRKGDNVRIDWGYFMMAASNQTHVAAVGDNIAMRREFAKSGSVEMSEAGDYMAISSHIGKVGSRKVEDYIMLGYDDLYSIRYFEQDMRPYWNRTGNSTIEQQFALAADSYADLKKRCAKFDAKLMNETFEAGGKEYAELCALAYRQAISAHKLIETPSGELAFLSKENFSNGSIGTVDVTYPSAPMFLYYNPELAKALINFIFYYAESGKWTKPYPAHDIGTYPWANGQTYGGDMPVEESGNMLILTGAICKIEGSADYALKHWDVLTTWTNYLVENGGDPANQLCTDDFAGHWARNANLSIKAIVGIAAYADMARMAGKKDVAEEYEAVARKMAAEWKSMAAQGDHYRLTFNEGDTWSQKYNLVWDKILDYNVFDADIAPTEVAYYLTKQNDYGLPLDCRRAYTKADWIVWSATMAESQEDFEALVKPVHRFMNETVDRIPMSDWYNTDSKHHVAFRARSVVGGYYIKLLSESMK
ncbi:MAG: DUF4965 domain-containing protein [Rikenellaceae bacterium]|nr:DUF4965 domain-containing protein [Rikenellaceae bacterium]